jgi:hypothetical protein
LKQFQELLLWQYQSISSPDENPSLMLTELTGKSQLAVNLMVIVQFETDSFVYSAETAAIV